MFAQSLSSHVFDIKHDTLISHGDCRRSLHRTWMECANFWGPHLGPVTTKPFFIFTMFLCHHLFKEWVNYYTNLFEAVFSTFVTFLTLFGIFIFYLLTIFHFGYYLFMEFRLLVHCFSISFYIHYFWISLFLF